MTIYKLGDLLNISSGSTPRKEKSLWKDEILWYTPIDLREKTHTIRKISKVNNKKWIPKNTVLISSRAPIGYVGIAKNTCWHSQGIKGFLNNEKSIINKYLYYWVISNRGTFISKGIGATFKEISSSIIKSIRGFFPSLKIQKQIIGIIEPKEKLFLKYSNCVRIDNFENTKKDLKALIGIIEPIEKIENEINRLERNMSKAIQFCINDILGEEEIELSSILKIQSSVQEGLISYGIGREGLFKNSSKANKLKKVGFFNICIGYVRNDHLDIGINRTIKNLGVSSAYKVIELAQGPLLAYFVYSFIKDNYLRLSLQSARGTGSISIKSLLKESIYINSKNLNKKASHFKNLILYTEKIYRIKTKISKLKFQLINNLTSYSSLNGIDN